jgi:hypothetical protein
VVYLHPFSRIHVKLPQHGLLTVPFITCVPSRRDESYRVRLQTLAPLLLIARGRGRYGLK